MRIKVTITLDVDPEQVPLADGVKRTAASVRDAVKTGIVDHLMDGWQNSDAMADGITDWSWS